MNCDLTSKLRIEISSNNSGKIHHLGRIDYLKERHYFVIKGVSLDGDAPKEFIKAYFFEKDGTVRKNNPRTWNQYLAKSAEKWYPHESIIEYLINNNDRHFYNWAVIRSIRKKETKVKFAPVYDSARGLLWNWSDKKVIKDYFSHFKGGKKVENYISSACPRISIEGDSEINHFDLVEHLFKNYPQYRETIKDLVTFDKQEKVMKMYHEKFSYFFIEERNDLVNLILNARFSRIREITDKYDQ